MGPYSDDRHRRSVGGRITCFDPNEPHAVYRIYDQFDRVIYIGMSYRPAERIRTHEAETRWYRVEAVRWTEQWYPNRDMAERAEYKAIRAEDPDHNFVGTEMAAQINRATGDRCKQLNTELRAARSRRIEDEKAAARARKGVAA